VILKYLLLAAVLCLLATGCSQRIRSYSMKDVPAQSEDTEIDLYSTGVLDCPYEILGTVVADRHDDDDAESQEELLDGMKQHARGLGGEAIIINPRDLDGDLAGDGKWQVIGTVILFADPGCAP